MVTVLLEPREGGQTLMTIRHTQLPPGLAGQHERGWAAIAGQLAAELAAGRPRLARDHDFGGPIAPSKS